MTENAIGRMIKKIAPSRVAQRPAAQVPICAGVKLCWRENAQPK